MMGHRQPSKSLSEPALSQSLCESEAAGIETSAIITRALWSDRPVLTAAVVGFPLLIHFFSSSTDPHRNLLLHVKQKTTNRAAAVFFSYKM